MNLTEDAKKLAMSQIAAKIANSPASTFGDTANVLNTITGRIIEVPANQLDLLQEYELVLRELPKRSCKACKGQGVNGFSTSSQSYLICHKCAKKMIDMRHAAQRTLKQIQDAK